MIFSRQSLLLIPIVLLFVGCGLLYEKYLDRQNEIRLNPSEYYTIGVAWDTENSNYFFKSFTKGIELGYEHFFPKQSLLGKRIKLEIRPTESTDADTRSTADHFVSDKRTIAVIGHPFSSLAEKASISYEINGILFIAPTATNDLVLQHDYNLVFRTISKDSMIYKSLLDYAMEQGWKNIAFIYESSSYGNNIYHNLMEFVHTYEGAQVLYNNVYPRSLIRPSLRTYIGKMKKNQLPDVIIASDEIESIKILCEELHLQDLSIPVLTSFAVFGDKSICNTYEHIMVPEQYDPDTLTAVGKKFVQDYREKYGEEPNMHSVQGYEALKFIADAIKKSNSFTPEDIASMLLTNNYEGVNGVFMFDTQGGILNKKLKIRPLYSKEFYDAENNATTALDTTQQ